MNGIDILYLKIAPWVWIGIAMAIYFWGTPRTGIFNVAYELLACLLMSGVIVLLPAIFVLEYQKTKTTSWNQAPGWVAIIAICIIAIILYIAYPAFKGLITGDIE